MIDPRTGQLLRKHLGQKRGIHRIHDEDRPKRTPPQLHQLLARAHKAGTNNCTVCTEIHHRQTEAGVRRITGMLSACQEVR
jgi:anaerobic selenocysteine-containing dehydrogenase